MKVALLTREYPPEVYGGAGVHVEYLSRELAALVDLTVHCWGAPREAAGGGPAVVARRPWELLDDGALRALSVDLAMAGDAAGADLVHSQTWYAQLGGHLASLLHGVPHVATVHSLEPRRPWKAEQLGGGYRVSSWAERTALEAADAIVAVSEGSRVDILDCYPAIDPDRVEVIYNGIDTEEYRPDAGTDVLERHGVDPALPYVLFVGRITRQKGVEHLLDAALSFDRSAQLVLCAGAPDTPEIAAAVERKVRLLRERRGGVVWLREMLPRREVVQLMTHARVLVCPSIYEPMGIVNLEAMACATAVVATATGGIVEVVADGENGLLVPFQPARGGVLGPRDPDAFARDIADRVNALLADPERAAAMGAAGRRRAEAHFSWPAIAQSTAELYERVAERAERRRVSPVF
ncbi:MAG TPA: glycogen synthase [Solirubrobacteraceae bacterium]|nr:glycogen synthase [Solirubrobacteraceae bacterium]